jgi:hypothetical protein
MATFCVNCGSPLNAPTAFCPQCGKPVGNRPAASAAPPPPYVAPAAPVPAAKSSAALKVVLVLVCCLALAGVVVLAGVFYVAHRVKQAVVQKAEENGVDLRSLGSSDTDRSLAARRLPKACDLLSKDDVSRLIGEPIERAEVNDAKCEYYGPPGLSGKLAQEEASAQLDHAKTHGGDPRMTAIELQRMLNRAGAQAGNAEAGSTGTGGELPLLVVGVSNGGKAAMSALHLAKGLLGVASQAVAKQQGENAGAAGDKMTSDVFVGTDIHGLGDTAMWTPKSGLYVLHGDILIQVNPSLFPDSNAKSVAVARAVLPKL